MHFVILGDRFPKCLQPQMSASIQPSTTRPTHRCGIMIIPHLPKPRHVKSTAMLLSAHLTPHDPYTPSQASRHLIPLHNPYKLIALSPHTTSHSSLLGLVLGFGIGIGISIGIENPPAHPPTPPHPSQTVQTMS